MSMNVNFYKGLSTELSTLTTYNPGSFYLTTDTSRLYYADAENALLDLNKYIIFKNSINDLKAAGAGAKGDIYYCVQENVLATYSADLGGWIQINTNTNTDTEVTKIDIDKVVTASKSIKVTITLTQTTYDRQKLNEVKSTWSTVLASFEITQADILSVVPVAVDVKGSMVGNNIAIDTVGLGHADSNVLQLVPGNGMTFDADDQNEKFTIKGTTYNMHSSGTNGGTSSGSGTAAIALADDSGKNGDDNASTVNFRAGKQLVLDGSTQDTIKYSHADITTETPAQTEKSGHAATFTYVKEITQDNGHVTKIATEQFTMPVAQDFEPTVTVDAGSITVETNDKTTGLGGTSTAQNALFYNLQNYQDEANRIYNTGVLPVYSIDEIDAKLRGVNAMTYKGTVNQDKLLPTSNVAIGDTYKTTDQGDFTGKFINETGASVSEINYEIGDLFIAIPDDDATEDANGHLSAVRWTYIPSGEDTDTQYNLSTLNTTIRLLNLAEGNSVAGSTTFKVHSGDNYNSDLIVTGEANATTGGTITYKHKSHMKSDAAYKANAPQEVGYSQSFVAVTGFTIDNGHIDEVKTTSFTLPDKVRGSLTTDASSPVIKLKDETFGTEWGQVAFSDDDYVNIANNGTNALKLTHKTYGNELKADSSNTEMTWDASYPVLYQATIDNGHVKEYKSRNYVMPSDPSIQSITQSGSATATKTIQSLNQNSSTWGAQEITFQTSTASLDFSASANATVEVNLLWRSFK